MCCASLRARRTATGVSVLHPRTATARWRAVHAVAMRTPAAVRASRHTGVLSTRRSVHSSLVHRGTLRHQCCSRRAFCALPRAILPLHTSCTPSELTPTSPVVAVKMHNCLQSGTWQWRCSCATLWARRRWRRIVKGGHARQWSSLACSRRTRSTSPTRTCAPSVSGCTPRQPCSTTRAHRMSAPSLSVAPCTSAHCNPSHLALSFASATSTSHRTSPRAALSSNRALASTAPVHAAWTRMRDLLQVHAHVLPHPCLLPSRTSHVQQHSAQKEMLLVHVQLSTRDSLCCAMLRDHRTRSRS